MSKRYGFDGNSFNSKRCDYERLVFFVVCPIQSFNSKRCDYEVNTFVITLCRSEVSIPKGAIMSFYFSHNFVPLRSFNSKRCDYEFELTTTIKRYMEVSIPKGAIMSKFKSILFYFDFVSIPKGAIMRILAICCILFHSICFNSKRCDYEKMQSEQGLALFSFNSKRCDYERQSNS